MQLAKGVQRQSVTRSLDSICPFLKQAEHLLKLGCEQI